jgi:hypothetical protein
MKNPLNPILDGICLWDRLEWLLTKTIQLHRRPDTAFYDHDQSRLAEFSPQIAFANNRLPSNDKPLSSPQTA